MLAKLLMEMLQGTSSSSKDDDDSTGVMDILRTVKSFGNTLGAQAGLYSQLLQLELEQEKKRLMHTCILAAIVLMSFWCFMLFAGVLLLAFVWESQYRIATIGGLVALFLAVTLIAVWRIKVLHERSGQAFASIRQELAADIAVIKSQL